MPPTHPTPPVLAPPRLPSSQGISRVDPGPNQDSSRECTQSRRSTHSRNYIGLYDFRALFTPCALVSPKSASAAPREQPRTRGRGMQKNFHETPQSWSHGSFFVRHAGILSPGSAAKERGCGACVGGTWSSPWRGGEFAPSPWPGRRGTVGLATASDLESREDREGPVGVDGAQHEARVAGEEGSSGFPRRSWTVSTSWERSATTCRKKGP